MNEGEWFACTSKGLSRLFRNIEEMLDETFKDTFQGMPRELTREERLPDGSIVRRFGPYVYGYSMTIGEDGRPVVREFGNIRPTGKNTLYPFEALRLKSEEKRQPLIDVIDDGKDLKVVAEMPGVEKEQIKLECTEQRVVVTADSGERTYHEEVPLPAKVDPTSAKASYRNGVLEVILKKADKKERVKKIRIE